VTTKKPPGKIKLSNKTKPGGNEQWIKANSNKWI